MLSNKSNASKKPVSEDKKKDKIKSVDSAPPVGSFDPHWLCEGISKLSVDTNGTKSQTEGFLDLKNEEADQLLLDQDDIVIQQGVSWTSVLRTPCDFEPSFFLSVMENLLQNPNITSTSLFRADILYDSAQDKERWDSAGQEGGFVKWMQKDLQPKRITIGQNSGLKLKRTIVRKLVPRKPWVDPELCQTVHFLDDDSNNKVKNVVVYIPHAHSKEKIPFYHPQVRALALVHSYKTHSSPTGLLKVSYQLFSPTDMDSRNSGKQDSSNRLQRTALNFLRIVHKHATGRKAGYAKRVHHDLVVPQKRFQDTYTALKAKYSQSLLDAWAEQTDPLKHVFEDLGIAAFLIEVWRDTYGLPSRGKSGLMGRGPKMKETGKGDKGLFPGFVDVGCGNGVLVYILRSEGFDGWGFDARKRKSWEVFPKEIQACLHQRILIPEPFVKVVQQHDVLRHDSGWTFLDSKEILSDETPKIHNGIFDKGVFIISNHADQLTMWTPLMAFLSDCPFISIPCCSHALSGKLQRFYDTIPEEKTLPTDKQMKADRAIENGTPSENTHVAESSVTDDSNCLTTYSHDKSHELVSNDLKDDKFGLPPLISQISKMHTPERGSLQPRKPGPSAYAGFSAHVMHVALDLGFNVRQEILRIPSTRNLCVLGLIPSSAAPSDPEDVSQTRNQAFTFDKDEKDEIIAQLLQREVNGDVNKAARDWIDEALGLIKPKAQKRRDVHEPISTDQSKQVLQRGFKTVLGLENLEDWEIDLLRPS